MAMPSSSMPSSNHERAGVPRWNLFARTLEDLLREHDNTPLSLLDNLRERPGEELDPDDPESPRELVHREKVRRLTFSLREPGMLSILSRDDVERISRYFRFDADERRRLSAATLATHIQRMVYERVNVKSGEEQRAKAATLALRAAELLLPTLEEALREVGEEDGQAFRTGESLLDSTGAPAALVGGWMGMTASGDASQRDDKQVYAALAGALDAVDRGTLALSLSYTAPGSAERLERARAARDAFSDALERLDDQEAWVRTSAPWRHWHNEARRGYDDADERVIDLGG